ncbi:probable ubiquitin carboxyl-terminal hydrolase MINDY-4 isoform X2 [Sphaeramia orbicularis]|uniref:probable ubiquitin carboxyl-terminal hydrolase MINDY-4 isoform X2 n=1 Tax=Sphaeramia orbicularis TaxID=375764 RepID=UPI00117CEAB4|nr:probable ubiquitin carboxyl-terminal hydrolase MINDY-4 isoform X2 [Sphaeramia orbicularis]
MVVSVEEVSSSLVREYLSRKGLKKTIACMDEEHPRTEASINNRSHLRQILNIEALYKKNKVQNSPLKTLLEIIVKHHIDGLKNDKKKSSDASATLSSPAEMNDTQNSTIITPITLRSHVEKSCPSQPTLLLLKTERISTHNQNPMASPQDNESSRTPVTDGIQKSRSSRIRRGMMPGPIASTPEELNKKRQMRRAEMPQPLLRREEENIPSRNGFLVTSGHQNSSENSADCMGGRWEVQSAAEKMQMENSSEEVGRLHILQTRKVQSPSRSNVANLNLSELVLDDIDDSDELQDRPTVSLKRAVVEQSRPACPMDQRTASELKAVLLGSSLNCFSVEWRNQGFTFSETHDLRYGIVQKKGGPCGVLASVQAFVLKKLLFETMDSNSGLQLRPSNTTRRNCLVLAVAEILWRAGEEKQAMIAISSGRKHFIPTGQYKSEGVLEKITLFTVDNFKDLQLLLEQHIEQFESGLLGCLLMVISAVLSRSIEKVKEDMDVPTTTLIGAHGYCTQELVNLLLCGQAVSNVFDNDMELDSGNGNMTLLKGMKGRCDVGLLSLFEHYNIVKVGTYLKTPCWPIWVVCSESHFSVLFGLQRELLTNQDKGLEFDLYYYDGLANQQEEIRLTVSLGRSGLSCQNNDPDLIPPLEHCIHTRWKDAFVHWNDTEPIL